MKLFYLTLLNSHWRNLKTVHIYGSCFDTTDIYVSWHEITDINVSRFDMLLHLVPPKFDPNFFSTAFLGDASTFCTHDISSNDIFQTFLWHSPHPQTRTGHSMIAQLFGDYSQKVVLLQGMLKWEVSLYHWPPVWLVWINLFCKQKQKMSVVIQLIPNQSNRRSTIQWYFPL